MSGDERRRRELTAWLLRAVSRDSAAAITQLKAMSDQVEQEHPELSLTSRVINDMIAGLQQTPVALGALYWLSTEETPSQVTATMTDHPPESPAPAGNVVEGTAVVIDDDMTTSSEVAHDE